MYLFIKKNTIKWRRYSCKVVFHKFKFLLKDTETKTFSTNSFKIFLLQDHVITGLLSLLFLL